jgi:hypothetical protein
VSGANDRGVYETQTASPERANELNREAVQRIENNIANGKAAIAASYLEACRYPCQRLRAAGAGRSGAGPCQARRRPGLGQPALPAR